MTVADEFARRLGLWQQLSTGDTGNADPSVLRSALVYGGAQGIWVDKKTTRALTMDGHGVTVSILHTGRHYPDDLSVDGLISYLAKAPPSTKRRQMRIWRSP